MPVHNAAPFLNESIRSILNQSIGEFEFVILDDASSDESPELLRRWEQRDSRIRVFRSAQQLGLAGSSNLVVSKTSTPFIARMDADDVSHPDRLARQLDVLTTQVDVVAVGTLFNGIDQCGRTIRPRDRWRLLRYSQYIPFPHGSAMFRRTAFDAVGGYGPLIPGEDQDFFQKLTRVGRVVTLPAALYQFRYHVANSTLFRRESATAPKQIVPRHGDELATLYLRAAMRLWSGQRPQMLPQMMAKGVLHWEFRSAVLLAWAALGSVSPGALRLLMRALIRGRDSLAALKINDELLYDWQPKRPVPRMVPRREKAAGELNLADARKSEAVS